MAQPLRTPTASLGRLTPPMPRVLTSGASPYGSQQVNNDGAAGLVWNAFNRPNTEFYAKGEFNERDRYQWQNEIDAVDFRGRPASPLGREYQEFVAVAKPRLTSQFAEFDRAVGEALGASDNPDAYAYLQNLVVRDLLGDFSALRNVDQRKLSPRDQRVREKAMYLRSQFMDWMQSRSMGGSEVGDTSVTPEQFEQWRNDPDRSKALNADYRLSPAGQEMLRNTVDYNLFSTFQTDQHRPLPLRSPLMNVVGSTIGSMYEQATTALDPSADSMEPNTPAGRQGRFIHSPNPVNAMRYAMGLYKDTQKADPEFYNTLQGGSQVPQASLMTVDGLANKTTTGATPWGRFVNDADIFLRGMLANAGLGAGAANAADRDVVSQIVRTQDRPTPIRYPEKSAAGAVDAIKGWVDGQRDGATVYFPRWMDKAGFQSPPRFPSAFVKDAANLPVDLVTDPATALSMAVSAPLGVLRGIASRSVGQALLGAAAPFYGLAREVAPELATSTGITLTQTPQSYYDYFTKADPSNPLRTPEGKIPDPTNKKEYNAAVAQWEGNREKALQSGRQFLQNQASLAAEAKKPAGRPRMKMLTELRDATAPRVSQEPEIPQMPDQFTPFSEDSPGMQLQREIERRNAMPRRFP